MSEGSSSETRTKSRRLSSYWPRILTRSGNSSRQGTHHVAQKLTSRGRARPAPAPSRDLSAASSISVTFGGAGFDAPGGGAGGFGVTCFRVTPKPPASMKAATTAGSSPFDITSLLARALDGAAEGLDLGLLDWLAGERRLDGVAQLRVGDRVSVARVVDAPAVDELAGGVEQVSLGRDLRVEAVGDLVVRVLQDGEGQPLLGRVRLDLGGRLGRVRVDADDVDAPGAVVLRQLLHALVVGVRDGALRRDEDDGRAGLALQGGERVLLAVGVEQREVGDDRADGGLGVGVGRGEGEREREVGRPQRQRGDGEREREEECDRGELLHNHVFRLLSGKSGK